jgi:hypothetical protein
VQSDLYRARSQLRTCLEQQGVSAADMLDLKLALAFFDCVNDPQLEDEP